MDSAKASVEAPPRFPELIQDLGTTQTVKASLERLPDEDVKF